MFTTSYDLSFTLFLTEFIRSEENHTPNGIKSIFSINLKF